MMFLFVSWNSVVHIVEVALVVEVRRHAIAHFECDQEVVEKHILLMDWALFSIYPGQLCTDWKLLAEQNSIHDERYHVSEMHLRVDVQVESVLGHYVHMVLLQWVVYSLWEYSMPYFASIQRVPSYSSMIKIERNAFLSYFLVFVQQEGYRLLVLWEAEFR